MDNFLLLSDCDHPQVIIHIDINCFYAQVEMIRNPLLKNKPVGIKQKNFMVTCNYVARSLGVEKSMRIVDALKILPDLVLIDGSDLTPYRHYSSEIFSILQTYTKCVEKLGLDENFIDVTDILDDYNENSSNIEGYIFSYNEDVDVHNECFCGCYNRLVKGTRIAKKIRDHIYNELGITTCAGIAHNKLIAKLVSGHKKPNNQTVVFPSQVRSVMKSLTSPKDIPSIGYARYKILESLGIKTLEDLQECSVDTLNKKFDPAFSLRMKNLAVGIDNSKVKPSGPPQTLSVEDAFTKISTFSEVKCKLEALLEHLLVLLQEDGRFPKCLRLTVRKFNNKDNPYGQRETKHTELHTSMFGNSENLAVTSKTKEELNKVSVSLFNKLVNSAEIFHLTLLGIGFTKFYERAAKSQGISQYFTKRLSTETSFNLHKKARVFERETPNENISKESTNPDNLKLDLTNIITSTVDSLSESVTDSYDFISSNSSEEIKTDLREPPSTKYEQVEHISQVGSSSKSKNNLNFKSRNSKSHPLTRQKKIDSFFIVQNKKENLCVQKFENVSSNYTTQEASGSETLVDRTRNAEGNQVDSDAADEQDRIMKQLLNRGIDVNVFNELPQNIKEEILATL